MSNDWMKKGVWPDWAARIYVDGHPIFVPKRVLTREDVRRVLGLEPGTFIRLEGSVDVLLFDEGYEFENGQRFEMIEGPAMFGITLGMDDADEESAPWHRGDAWWRGDE